MKYFFCYSQILFLICSCGPIIPGEVRNALDLAEENRPELEKVLAHYSTSPADSLKYQAACFLIENMPFYGFYEGELLDNYLPLYGELALTGKDPQAVLDSFTQRYGRFSTHLVERKRDIKEIKASFLMDHIEWAFKVWEEQPWGKNVSFADFCECILPYRIEDEQPTLWRQKLYEKYNCLLNSYRDLPEAADPLFAARVVLDSLSKGDKHFTTILPGLPHIGPDLCEQWRTGSCRELTDLTVYVLRALGIPCGIDFMPVHARGNAGHFWTFILDMHGETYTSDYLDASIGILRSEDNRHFTSKVYRRMFGRNKELEKQLLALSASASFPPFFSYPRIADATSLYTGNNPIRAVSIPDSAWYDENTKLPIVYLCVSQRQGWVPVAWARYRKGQTRFENVKSDIIFRIAGWKNEQLEFQTGALKMTGANGKIQLLEPREQQDTVCLLSKFEIYDTEGFTRLMVNGVFEVSNDRSFIYPDTLAVIEEAPVRLQNTVFVNPQKRYRYIRYKGPENSHCDVAEILFFENKNDTNACAGTVIGTPNDDPAGSRNEYTKAFDGDPYTSFHYKNASDGWVGLDFGRPVSISKIIYTPRNRDNFIRKGDEYELYYLDKKWVSLGVKVAATDSLVYGNAPSGSLLYLQNHTRGHDERIFTYENGKQVWW
ncbi:MAG: discoidin domain-containing protein [Prolixibacteraceae bacterium]